jgi:hypothetical protein
MAKGACGSNLSTEKGKALCLKRRKEGHKACSNVASRCPYKGKIFILKESSDMNVANFANVSYS